MNFILTLNNTTKYTQHKSWFQYKNDNLVELEEKCFIEIFNITDIYFSIKGLSQHGF
jgi:hypothetical protein